MEIVSCLNVARACTSTSDKVVKVSQGHHETLVCGTVAVVHSSAPRSHPCPSRAFAMSGSGVLTVGGGPPKK